MKGVVEILFAFQEILRNWADAEREKKNSGFTVGMVTNLGFMKIRKKIRIQTSCLGESITHFMFRIQIFQRNTIRITISQ